MTMSGGLRSKKGASLLWTLLECIFFSGVVLGWSWLALIFRAERYQLGDCNITHYGITSRPLPPPPSPTIPAHGPQPRLARRRCRPKSRTTHHSSPGKQYAAVPRGAAANSQRALLRQNMLGKSLAEATQYSSTERRYSSTERRASYRNDRSEDRGRNARDASTQLMLLQKLEKRFLDRGKFSQQSSFTQNHFGGYVPAVGRHVPGSSFHQGHTRIIRDAPRPPDDSAASSLSASSLYQAGSSAPTAMSRRWQKKESGEKVCLEQREMLRLMLSIVAVLRDMLVLPVGAFLDKYGTTRTRVITVLIFAVGTLMMTFTTAGVPWLMVPALTLTGVAGVAVLLTNVQIANLFGRRRHLVVCLYCGASLSSGFITYMMQLSHQHGVDVQTSFMFLTIGLVPMLVSTVAFLPKTRVPWPLPSRYGARRSQSLDENLLRREKAWKRRLMEAGVAKFRRPIPKFWPKGGHQLLVGIMFWYGVQSLHSAQLETLLVDVGHWEAPLGSDLEHVFGWIQLLSLPLAVLPGLLIDRERPKERRRDTGTRQMQNLVPALLLTPLVGMLERVMVMVVRGKGVPFLVLSYVLHALHRVSLLSTVLCYLLHVHFAQEHSGKYVGLTLLASAFVSSFQFPIRSYYQQNPFAVHSIMISLLALTLGHALIVWHRCRRGLIRDHPDSSAFSRAFCSTGQAFRGSHSYMDTNSLLCADGVPGRSSRIQSANGHDSCPSTNGCGPAPSRSGNNRELGISHVEPGQPNNPQGSSPSGNGEAASCQSETSQGNSPTGDVLAIHEDSGTGQQDDTTRLMEADRNTT